MTPDDRPDYLEWLSFGPPELRDFRRRLWWAQEDGEALNAEIEAFTNSQPHGMRIEFDGERWYVTFRRLIDEREEWAFYDRTARTVGSFLDNNRAALNYLAVELAKLSIRKNPSLADPSLPWDDRLHPESVEFPIFKAKAKFFSVGEDRIRKLPNPYRGAIQDIQPYHGGYKGLWDLQVLSAEYRHRVIHPVAVLPHRHLFKVLLDDKAVRTTDTSILVDDGPIKNDTEVMSFKAPDVPPDRYKDVKPQITISIGLDHPLCRGRDIGGVFTRIGKDVIQIAQDFEPFFE